MPEPTKTIAHARAGRETALTVHCLGEGCHHQAVKTFEELKLWNDMIFVDVPKHRQFVCTKCGSRNVKVMPIFPAARGTPGYENSELKADYRVRKQSKKDNADRSGDWG